jgi:membrane-associated phospholipid phosphatase
MNGPKDHSAEVTVGTIRFARTFSNIVSPPVIFAILGLALGIVEDGLWLVFLWAAVFGFLVSLAPILFIVYIIRICRITVLHMSSRQDRYIPYLVSITASGLALLVISLFDGPVLLGCLTILNIIVHFFLGLVNTVWLISIHTASVSAAAFIIGLVFGWGAAAVFSPMLIMVCWARRYLRRHTPGQVLAGLVLGFSGSGVLALLGCFT